ncbi:MAG: hypothetical protein R6U61_01185 [Thermoplasmata archaeon]
MSIEKEEPEEEQEIETRSYIEILVECPFCGGFVPDDFECLLCGHELLDDEPLSVKYVCSNCRSEVDENADVCPECAAEFY